VSPPPGLNLFFESNPDFVPQSGLHFESPPGKKNGALFKLMPLRLSVGLHASTASWLLEMQEKMCPTARTCHRFFGNTLADSGV